MRALFFEVTPKPGHDDHYFNIAAMLKPRVEQNPGLLFLDRFRSLTRPGTILSYQHWRDEASLVAWREDTKHYGAQKAGREKHFADYRLQICGIVNGFRRGETEGDTFQSDSSATDRFVMAIESEGRAFPRGEPFESVNREGAHAAILHIASREEGDEILRDAQTQDYVTRAILCAVDRDYSMFERDEAPQDFAPVEPST